MNSSWARVRMRSSEGWNEKSKPVKVLMLSNRPILSAPPALAQGQFLAEQGLQRLRSADLTALQAAQGLIEHLQRPRHLETDEVAADPVNEADGGRPGHHDAPPSAASRRPTAS